MINFNLSDLNGSNGFILSGIDGNDRSGSSVSSAGDINDDGFDDLLIGAPLADPNESQSGESYVVFGRSSGFDASFDLSSLDGTNGFTINGIDLDDLSGRSVSGAGDINGDGIDDLVIGAANADPNGPFSGESYVVFGRSDGFDASLELSELDGANGFTINGIDVDDGSGSSVSGAGDINGDGVDDLVIRAPYASLGDGFSDQSYVVFGRSDGFDASLELSELDGTNGFVLNRLDPNYNAIGRSVSGAGDINGDGLDDLLIGASFADPSEIDSGQSYVVFGRLDGFGALLELSTLDGSNGFTINGIDRGDKSGSFLDSAGDVNGDGLDDLIIGAYGANPNGNSSGQSYVVFGRSDGFDASLELSMLDGANGFSINGINASDQSGFSVGGAGDINGDGFDDLIVGSINAGRSTIASDDDAYNTSLADSYVVFGRSGGFEASIELSTLDGSDGFIITALGAPNSDSISSSIVSGAGDVNGDGFDDLLIGYPNAGIQTGQGRFQGQSYVLFGAAPSSSIDGLTLESSLVDASEVTQGSISTNLRSGILSANFLISNRVDVTGFTDVIGTAFNDELEGSAEDNQLLGRLGNDTLFGRNGKDRLIGNQGDDFLSGGRGRDLLRGNTGNDTLNGEGGSDGIIGGSGADLLTGGRGNDRLFGKNGNDRIFAGGHDDLISGGNGRDTLQGGAGADIFQLEKLASFDVVTDFTDGTDLLGLTEDISFNDLSFSGNEIALDGQLLARLNGVETSTLTLEDFISA